MDYHYINCTFHYSSQSYEICDTYIQVFLPDFSTTVGSLYSNYPWDIAKCPD